jgi:hypothetical protein
MSVVAGILPQASTVPNSDAFSRACPLGLHLSLQGPKYRTAEPQLLCQGVEYHVFYLDKELASCLVSCQTHRSLISKSYLTASARKRTTCYNTVHD